MDVKGKKILITGGAGFIGANFVYKFLELGSKVTVMERKNGDTWRLRDIINAIDTAYVDLTDAADVENVINKIKPDIVIHLAAYGAYQRFQQDTHATIDTNLKGTINLVNACQKVGVEAFINTGSSSEYGIKNAPMKETDLLEADNLYGITKGATTMYCQMMAKKHGFPVATIRPFAVYGPFEEKGRLITEIITSRLGSKALTLSSPNSVRDFIFIDDLFSGYLSAIKYIGKVKGLPAGRQGEIFNLGTGKQHSIKEVVATVKKITGSGVKPIYGSMQKAQTEPKTWVADISKARKLLKWKPKYSLEQGLKKDIEWFKEHLEFYA